MKSAQGGSSRRNLIGILVFTAMFGLIGSGCSNASNTQTIGGTVEPDLLSAVLFTTARENSPALDPRISGLANNLVLNGSFEDDAASPPNQWTNMGAGSLDARWGSTSPDGNRFSTFTSLTTSLSGRQAHSNCFALDPTQELKATGYFRSKNAPQRVRAGFKVLYFSDANCTTPASRAYHTQNSYNPSARNVWEFNEWSRSSGQMPADAQSAYLVIRAKYVSGVGSNTDKVDFDDIRVTNGTGNTGGAGGSLRIGSFNIQILANTKFNRLAVRDVLVNTAIRYDALFIQELRNAPDRGDDTGPVIRGFLDAVNAASGNAYQMVISPRLGNSSPEQYVLFYRPSKVSVVSHHVYADPADDFLREPHIVRLRAGTEEFYVANLHIQPTSAYDEIMALADVAASLNDPDILILGDLNADCTYFNENTQWSDLSLIGDGYVNIIGNAVDSSVYTTTDCTYDRILMSPSLADNLTAGSPDIFRFDSPAAGGFSMSGILTEGCNDGYLSCGASSNDAAKKVSDHYPIQADFVLQ